MSEYIHRKAEKKIEKLLSYFPAVAIVGPRQVGKTSLALAMSAALPKPTVYLDLENPNDLAKLENPSLFLEPLAEHTVILDEVQRKPDLFPVLRGIIDKHRVPGRFILLGSASPDLIRDSSESLAGRIAYHELMPISFDEISGRFDFRQHWFRGGFPESLLAPDDELSGAWRQNFIRTYLERDLPLLGLSADPVIIGRLWQMLAHLSGNLLNMETIAKSLGINGTTVRRYIDFMEAAYLVKRLTPFYANIKKRLVKSPKIYIRDTGILHQLLGIPSFIDLAGHPSVGASWETYIVEQLLATMPDTHELHFFRTHAGAEADVVISRAGKPEVLIEIKYSTAPKPSKGFFHVVEDLKPKRQFLICPVDEGHPLSEDLRVLSYREIERIFEVL